ncbi:MAG: hypothetical protein K0S61_2915 [Anaerocolumna sp.]|nr:hypothetical protein [Anaerocolumna sp.]
MAIIIKQIIELEIINRIFNKLFIILLQIIITFRNEPYYKITYLLIRQRKEDRNAKEKGYVYRL